MTEKVEIIFKLFKAILSGLLIMGIFCWVTILDPFFMNPIEKDLRLIFQKKIVTKGVITKAKWLEDFVEVSDTEFKYVDGYEYSYTFASNKGENITTESFTYGELPNYKKISQIPFQVSIEYLAENPKINRIILPYNNESFWDVFNNMLILPLMMFVLCCYFSFLFIKPAIVKYRIETKRNRES
jgi:hypothetical protein